jgi:hypothetical protein
MKINWTYATKAIVSIIGTAELLVTQYPHISWQQMAAGAATSFLVWLVPNTPKVTPVVTPVVTPPTNVATIPMTVSDRAELENLRAQRVA